MRNIFERATKNKLRFESAKGQLSVEQLWELSLVSLDNIAKSVNKQLKEAAEESFIAETTPANTTLELKLEILKYIIQEKKTQLEVSKNRAEKQAQLNTLKELRQQKALENLAAAPLSDLDRMIAELEKEV